MNATVKPLPLRTHPFEDRRTRLGEAGWMECHALNATPITGYQVLGERSSGTNYLDKLLERNLSIKPHHQFQWKHGFPLTHVIPRDKLTIVSFRDPMDWLRSMHKKPWHAPDRMWTLPMSEFLRSEWHTQNDRWTIRDDKRELRRLESPLRYVASRFWNDYVRQKLQFNYGWVSPSDKVASLTDGLPMQHDLDPLSGLPFANIMKLRSAKLQGHLSLRHRHCNYVFVCYETVRDHPEAFVDLLTQAFDLSRKGPFKGVSKWLGTLPDDQQRQGAETPQDFSPEDEAFIWSQLDPDLEADLGYLPGTARS